MPSASDISDSISPGSLEYGDRQVVEDRIQQAAVAAPAPRTPGAASSATQGKLAQGGVSDLPVTSGLSVGPGAGPSIQAGPPQGARPEQLRLIATNARNPLMRKLARDTLRATLLGGS